MPPSLSLAPRPVYPIAADYIPMKLVALALNQYPLRAHGNIIEWHVIGDENAFSKTEGMGSEAGAKARVGLSVPECIDRLLWQLLARLVDHIDLQEKEK